MKVTTIHFKIRMVAILLFLTATLSAQVNITLNVLPPYSPYFRDYLGYATNNKTLITLLYTNPSANVPIKVFLTASIRKDDQTISAEVKDTYKPALPIDLLPNIPKTLTGTQLQTIFGNGTANDLILKGITMTDVITNQAMPEGNYSLCVKVRDYITGNLLAEDCRSMFIAYSEPPQFTYPINNTTEFAKVPQYLMFSWSPVTPFIQGTTYRLRLVKVPMGVSIYDALNYSTQVVLEKSNIQTTNFALDLASGIKLDTGAVYAAQVTAVSKNAYIKNNGKSEPVQFLYKALPGWNFKPPVIIKPTTTENIVFLNPKKTENGKPDTLEVNNENDLLLNWCWLKTKNKDTVTVADKEIIQQKDLKKYTFSIERVKTTVKNSPAFAYNAEFMKVDSTGMIKNFVQLSDSQAMAAGFVTNDVYRATLRAFDAKNKEVVTLVSPDFVFVKVADETPTFKIPLMATINYGFKNNPEIFPVINSEVTVEAFKMQNSSTSANIIGTDKSKLFNSLPAENIHGINYVKISSAVFKTDSMGKLSAKLSVPQKYFDTDSISYRIKLANNYYVDKDFGMKTVPVSKKDSTVNFGYLTAKTYAYQLKINVRKEFKSYSLVRDEKGLSVSLTDKENLFTNSSNQAVDNQQSYIYTVGEDTKGKDTIAEGIPVVLYRKNKQENIPIYEGNITKSSIINKNKLSNITVVALGTTVREKDSTYVTFNNLLSTNKQAEEYYILAIKNLKDFLNPVNAKNSVGIKNVENNMNNIVNNAGLTVENSQLIANAVMQITKGYSTTNFVDSGKFVAEEKPFYLPLPQYTETEDAYYRFVKTDYSITSCTPPTSLIKGRLFYVWKSDKNIVKRPLANTHFRVIVDYVDEKNVSIGAVKNSQTPNFGMGAHWEYTAFVENGTNNKIPLVDQYATMAEGVTDSEGNFSIEVVNLNKKGDLGAGEVIHSEGSSKPPVTGQTAKDKLKGEITGEEVVNPMNQFNDGFANSQNSLKGNAGVSFDAATQSFEVKGLKGSQVGNKAGAAMSGGMMFSPLEDEIIHGPNPSTVAPAAEPTPENSTTSTKYDSFRRQFRIVIDGDKSDYYYPSREVIEIQPFESMTTPIDITHYVKEFRVVATTFDNETKDPLLGNIQVTLFRKNDKPANLPLGEGDGKYLYKELVSPVYIEDNTNLPKFEQLWPSQLVKEFSGVPLPGQKKNCGVNNLTALLQSEYKNYLVQSSSTVNTSGKSFDEKIELIPEFTDKTTDWANPEIPVVNVQLYLSPLKSRILAHVRESGSNKPLTTDRNTRVVLSKSQTKPTTTNYYNSKAVDKYGYAEFLLDEMPTSIYFKFNKGDLNPDSAYFSAIADGYTYGNQPSYKVVLMKTGTQNAPVLTLYPTAQVTGKLLNADAFEYTPGASNTDNPVFVPSYIQVDSGKVYETNIADKGVFTIPIAPKAGVKIKIIPKDVAWFDTTLVLTKADESKQLINLGNINLYRRKHRIQLNVFTKTGVQNVIQNVRVKDATIKLGETLVKTDQYGRAQFKFENVSVNNYTFVINGPEGQGYIPKTLNLKNEETRDFVNVDVILEKGSEIKGTVKLDGKPVKNARVYLEVQNSSSSPNNINYALQSNSPSSNVNNSQGAVQINQNNPGNYQFNPNLPPANSPTGSVSGDANLVVAYTDAAGKYTLKGVPVNNQKINVIATIDTTFTVSGDKQQADIKNGNAQLDLNLTSFGTALVNKLYGFPLTVEKITPVSQSQIKVTGLVHWTEAISDFTLNEINKVLRVEDVLFDIKTAADNSSYAVVHENTVKIPGITDLKLSYIDKYNVKLSANNMTNLFNTKPLQFTRDNNLGKIDGYLQIEDNSFNYPSSYLDFTGSKFYLARLNNSKIDNKVSVATSAFTETESVDKSFRDANTYLKGISTKISTYKQQAKPVYYLCNNKADSIEFKLINFKAKADPVKSFIDENGKIHLNTTLTCHIANAQPENFKVVIPKIILDENKLQPASSATPIQLKLEDWTLEIRDWTFSTKEGGILSHNSIIKTNIVDIPVDTFVLRSDMFIMRANLKNLSLAGGKFPLTIAAGKKPQLNYEYKVGTDIQPHWNFSLLGSGSEKVASLPKLKGLPDNYRIDLNYIEILSNNEMIVQMMQKEDKPLLFGNKVARFEPLTLFNGPNYINVSGLLHTGAPRMSDVMLTAKWSDPNSTPTFEKVSTDFEAKGFVHFEAKKKEINIDNNLVTIKGRVLEKPDLTFNPLPATFYARNSGTPVYEVMLQKDWITQLAENEPDGIEQPKISNKGFSLKIESGGMTVENNDWTTLKYSGEMTGNEKTDDNMSPTKVNFEVLGDVSANSDEMKVSNNTSFGTFTTCFDFKAKELRGTLVVDVPGGITLGSVIVYKASMGTCFGGNGFYIAGGMRAFLPMGILAGIYNLGMMAGYHPLTDELWGVTNACMNPAVVNTCYKIKHPQLSGFYFTASREIINFEESFGFVLADGYVRAVALLGGSFYVNYVPGNFETGAEGFVHADVSAGLSAITGTSISGGVKGDGKVGFVFAIPKENSHFYTTTQLGFEAKIEQDLGFKTVSASKSVNCVLSAKAGVSGSGFNFSFGSDGDKLVCP